MIRLLSWLLALSSLSSAPLQAAPGDAPGPDVLASTSLPAHVLPHCLYGLDPHDKAVQAWPAGPLPRGYRVAPSTQLHLLSWLGFREGDIIASVNDLPLGTAEHHYAARLATQGATHCRWSILRDDLPGVVEATITPGSTQALVLERDDQGRPTRLSRAALHQRLSDPYAFGPYASMLAMAADQGVYVVDKGLVALMAELGFQPLDHHLSIADVGLDGGRALLEGLAHLLTDPQLDWTYQRGGQTTTLELRFDGDAVALPALETPPPQPPVLPEP